MNFTDESLNEISNLIHVSTQNTRSRRWITIILPNAQTVEVTINYAWLTKSENFLRLQFCGETELNIIKIKRTNI